MIVKARFVVPVEGPVLENGYVEIADGQIVNVGTGHLGAATIDYGDAVILPGFVNAHTHLELTGLAGKVPPGSDFTQWLFRLLVALPADSLNEQSVKDAVRLGIRQSLDSGVTLIGDISRSPAWSREVLADSRLTSVSFGEVIAIGTRRHLLPQRLDAASSLKWSGDRLIIGISPHAPYTLEPEGLSACATRARSLNMPLCIHLAETREEELFTREGRGPFVEYLKRLGIWDDRIPIAGVSPVELAEQTGLLGSRTVVAHGNYLSDDDIGRLATSGTHVAYCPRTHHAFGHSPHPYEKLLQAGVNVCLGTDSLASNPSLSILDEMRFLRSRYPSIAPHQWIEMGTLRGANALGLAQSMGSIAIGKRADLTVVSCGSPQQQWDSFLDDGAPPVAVYVWIKKLVAGPD